MTPLGKIESAVIKFAKEQMLIYAMGEMTPTTLRRVEQKIQEEYLKICQPHNTFDFYKKDDVSLCKMSRNQYVLGFDHSKHTEMITLEDSPRIYARLTVKQTTGSGHRCLFTCYSK